ncbi:MAG: aspartate-semialdehyde dehydrogenase [Alphaproteobacteria bacterium]|nr:aspartate-semialdehyde dehydrogenase [Alphaproteobacteria bacterium]
MEINTNKHIIIVGVTGLVGREMLKILESIDFPFDNIDGCASSNSEGKLLNYKGKQLIVRDINNIDFSNYNIALFSAGSEVSKVYAPIAIEKGCTVIDNTSYFRMRDNVPLVVPEINMNSINGAKLIANPNCSTIQMVMPLKPLHDVFELKELVISTYQASGGAGQKGINALLNETGIILNNKNSYKDNNSPFNKQIAFNVIPQIDKFDLLDYTKEEWKMINETKKILDLPNIDITATCVRVPVIRGHAVSVFAKFNNVIDISRVKEVLSNFSGIKVVDDPNNQIYTTPIDCANKNDVFVSRMRKHPTIDNGLNFWCVSDNVRKGAALNAIQIASLLQ